MAARPEPAEQERITERLDPQRGGAGLWFRRHQAFNGQRRSASFHWYCRRPAFHRHRWRTALHGNSRRAALHRRHRSRGYFDLGRFREPVHRLAQRFAKPIQPFSQPFSQSFFLVGQHLRRIEQRCQC